MSLKVGDKQSACFSLFEVVNILPGFDVGAYLHHQAEEMFYVLEGQLELLAFEPRARTSADWQQWESPSGARVARGGPGSFMFVPHGCPHGFANPGPGRLGWSSWSRLPVMSITKKNLQNLCPRGRAHWTKPLENCVLATTSSRSHRSYCQGRSDGSRHLIR